MHIVIDGDDDPVSTELIGEPTRDRGGGPVLDHGPTFGEAQTHVNIVG